jgi:hypothetical protein
MTYEKIMDGIRYRFAVINGERQDFYLNELGEFFHKNGTRKNICKPSGNEKYFTISYKKNGKTSKTSVHRCLQETFNGHAIEDNNWEKLRPKCFTKKQWMNFTEEQRIFLSRSGIHVDHMNGVKHDNNLSNLQYLWAADNIAKGNSSSDPAEQAKVMLKKTQALVKKVCYKRPDGTLAGDSKHDIDLASYENMVSFIREELRVLNDPRIIMLTKFQWRRLRQMNQFITEHKIAA